MRWWLLSMALGGPAHLEGVSELSLRYEVTHEVNEAGDRYCNVTGVCDCTASFRGKGAFPQLHGDRVTFTGTFEQVSNSCHPSLSPWVPADGAAHHSFVLDASGAITEWVVHDEAGAHQKKASQVKQSGQYWMDALGLAWTRGTPATARQRDSGDLGMGIRVDSTHVLTVTLE